MHHPTGAIRTIKNRGFVSRRYFHSPSNHLNAEDLGFKPTTSFEDVIRPKLKVRPVEIEAQRHADGVKVAQPCVPLILLHSLEIQFEIGKQGLLESRIEAVANQLFLVRSPKIFIRHITGQSSVPWANWVSQGELVVEAIEISLRVTKPPFTGVGRWQPGAREPESGRWLADRAGFQCPAYIQAGHD
jgi:hypothetical protein